MAWILGGLHQGSVILTFIAECVQTMKIDSLADVKACFDAYVEQCETDGTAVIMRTGKAVVVRLWHRLYDDDPEGLWLAWSRRPPGLVCQIVQSIKNGKGLS